MAFLKHLCIFIVLLISPHLCFAGKCKYGFISSESKDELHPVLTRSIDVFDLSVRAREALKAQAIYYIGDLIIKTETDLTRISHIKKEDIIIIKAFLSKMDLRLGTDINWPSHREEVEALVIKLNPKVELSPVFARSIETLELPIKAEELIERLVSFLKSKGIYYLGDLVAKTEVDLIKWDVEKKNIIAIIKALTEINLRLGLNIEWPSGREEVEALVQKLAPQDELPSIPLQEQEGERMFSGREAAL